MTALNSSVTPQPKAKSLIVDDSLMVRAMLRRFLERDGYEVLEAESLAEVNEMGDRAADIAVAWLDLHLRDGEGTHAASRLRAIAPDISLIIMSADAEADLDRAADEAAATFFLPKPIPYPMFHIMQHNALKAHERAKRQRALAAIERFLGQEQHRCFTDLNAARPWNPRRVLAGVAQQLSIAVATNGICALSNCRDGTWRCQCTVGRAFHRKWNGAAVPDDDGLLHQLLAGGEPRQLAPQTAVVRNTLLRDLRGRRLLLVPQMLPSGIGGMIWVFVRDSEAPPFSEFEVNLIGAGLKTTALVLDAMVHVSAMRRTYQEAVTRLDSDWMGFLIDHVDAPVEVEIDEDSLDEAVVV